MFLVFCGLPSLAGTLVCSPATVFQEPKSGIFSHANAVVLRYSCVAALQLGVKVTSSDCLGVTFCSKPGHLYQWGGRFGMCNCALYLKGKEKNREKCHFHIRDSILLSGWECFPFFFVFSPHFATASHSQIKSGTCTLRFSE